MKKNNENKNGIVFLTSIVCLLPILLGLLMYDKLPASIATHWNFHGEADGFMPKKVAIFATPIIMTVINIILYFSLKMDPKKKNYSKALKSITMWIVPIMDVVLSSVTIFIAVGAKINITTIIFLLIGIIFVAVGNYLPKTKQNFTLGVRVPWTLNNEENWNKTHHLDGFIMVITGFLLILTSFVSGTLMMWFRMILLVVSSLIPIAYSYILYKKGI